MSEVTGEKPFEYYLDLARTAPKIEIDDPRVESGEDYGQFGNNFYVLWQLLQLDTPQEPGGAYDRYAGRALSNPGWEAFTQANAELIGKINEALVLMKPYKELHDKMKEFFMNHDEEAEEQLEAAAAHPLCLEAIRLYAWDKLNPLLKEIALRMEEAGIDPHQFY